MWQIFTSEVLSFEVANYSSTVSYIHNEEGNSPPAFLEEGGRNTKVSTLIQLANQLSFAVGIPSLNTEGRIAR